MPRPRNRKGNWKPNAKRFERVSETRQRTQKQRNSYQEEIRHLNAEIRKSSRVLMELDEARRQGRKIDPVLHAEALAIRNTATTRLGIVRERLDNMLAP